MSYLRAHEGFWKPYQRWTPGPLRKVIGALAGSVAPRERSRGAQLAEALTRAGDGNELFWSGANSFWNVHKDRTFSPRSADGPWETLRTMGLDITGLDQTNSGAVVDGYLRRSRPRSRRP